MVSTSDFVSIERHGLIFAPSNRDVTLFRSRSAGCTSATTALTGDVRTHIWTATSPDPDHWGDVRLVLESAVRQAGLVAVRRSGNGHELAVHLSRR
ncbi:MAG: hypothetical protein U0703_10605 [Anaerolineae bacterium]